MKKLSWLKGFWQEYKEINNSFGILYMIISWGLILIYFVQTPQKFLVFAQESTKCLLMLEVAKIVCLFLFVYLSNLKKSSKVRQFIEKIHDVVFEGQD